MGSMTRGKQVAVNGRKCQEFVRESKVSGEKDQLFLDAERAFHRSCGRYAVLPRRQGNARR